MDLHWGGLKQLTRFFAEEAIAFSSHLNYAMHIPHAGLSISVDPVVPVGRRLA